MVGELLGRGALWSVGLSELWFGELFWVVGELFWVVG